MFFAVFFLKIKEIMHLYQIYNMSFCRLQVEFGQPLSQEPLSRGFAWQHKLSLMAIWGTGAGEARYCMN